MNFTVFLKYLIVMAGVTYLIRMIPLVLIKRKIENRFIRSFLYYIPYAVLSVMTIPMILLVFGLVVCCFAAARDGFDKSVQNVIDGSCDPGIFGLSDIPTVIGYIGALLIVVAAIATPIAKMQTAREVWFFVMAGGAVMKILTVEISRIIIRLR